MTLEHMSDVELMQHRSNLDWRIVAGQESQDRIREEIRVLEIEIRRRTPVLVNIKGDGGNAV